ncbi:MAG: DUF192 domain-containing protein [Candidatus Micrarchaeales archaeon]
MNNPLVLLAIIVVGIALLYLFAFYPIQHTSYSHFIINGKSFGIAYVASNYSVWTSGLMNKTITNSTTMLFVFPKPSIYPFWMYDTYSNLDMFWINGTANGGRIVYIAKNVTSCFVASSCAIYTPNAFANYVLEAKGGFAIRNNITVGSRISFG